MPDPRAAHAGHRLIDILVTALNAMVCDAPGWDDIEDFARTKAPWFATFMDLEHPREGRAQCRHIPPHPGESPRKRHQPAGLQTLERWFIQWMNTVVEQSQGRLPYPAIDIVRPAEKFAVFFDAKRGRRGPR